MTPLALIPILVAALSAPEWDRACLKNCALSDNGASFISHFEGYSPYVYKDSAGLPTIGIGHLIRKGESFEEPMTPEEAHDLLKKDAEQAIDGVNRRVKVELKQHQADALISFTFNLGEGSLKNSSLLKLVNLERHDEVPPKFLPWDKARVNGRLTPVRGLTIRRNAESKLYEG